MIEVASAPQPPSPRERLKHAATVAAGLGRRYGPLALVGAVGWLCGYGLLGGELKLSTLPAPWGKLPAAWLLPVQKAALTLVAEAIQSISLPRGHRVQWAVRGASGGFGATIVWQWNQLDHGQGILLYGLLVALMQLAPSPIWRHARGLRALGWLVLWLMARTITWSLALLLTAILGQRTDPLVGWALGGLVSGLLLAVLLRLGPKESPRPPVPPLASPSFPGSPVPAPTRSS